MPKPNPNPNGRPTDDPPSSPESRRTHRHTSNQPNTYRPMDQHHKKPSKRTHRKRSSRPSPSPSSSAASSLRNVQLNSFFGVVGRDMGVVWDRRERRRMEAWEAFETKGVGRIAIHKVHKAERERGKTNDLHERLPVPVVRLLGCLWVGWLVGRFWS